VSLTFGCSLHSTSIRTAFNNEGTENTHFDCTLSCYANKSDRVFSNENFVSRTLISDFISEFPIHIDYVYKSQNVKSDNVFSNKNCVLRTEASDFITESFININVCLLPSAHKQNLVILLWFYIYNIHERSPMALCKQLSIILQRSCCKKHDFIVFLKNLKSPTMHLHFVLHELSTILHTFFNITAYKSKLKSHFNHSNSVPQINMDLSLNKYVHCIKKEENKLPLYTNNKRHICPIGGGGRVTGKSIFFRANNLTEYMTDVQQSLHPYTEQFQYVKCIAENSSTVTQLNLLVIKVPLAVLVNQLPISQLKIIAKQHNIYIPSRTNSINICEKFTNHKCKSCVSLMTVFEPVNKKPKKAQQKQKSQRLDNTPFPPLPNSSIMQEKICRDFCKNLTSDELEESGCAVCGHLNPIKKMKPLKNLRNLLEVLCLNNDKTTRIERKSLDEDIQYIEGPIVDEDCQFICFSCEKYLLRQKIPPMSLANGGWIGKIPEQLQNLSWAEKMLISRVQHNRCIIRVQSGMHKMMGNAILFPNPMPQIYNILPPPRKDLDSVLAFIYTGPNQPTEKEYRRTPLLVRRNKVANALEWLKLNHADYADLMISYKNLMTYKEDVPPVIVEFRSAETNKNPESVAVNDNEAETGVDEGECPITVHGLTGSELETMDMSTLRAVALNHLTKGGKVLAIGQYEKPESIYNNPQLYSSMFPWLFPYGLGGIGNENGEIAVSDLARKRHLLMYHDKRFQKDPYFPLIAFNHEQIKNSVTGGILLANKTNFVNTAERLMNIDPFILEQMSTRMTNGEHVKPESEQEKNCFQLINDLDCVASHVEGSSTSRKYMRNEIWSLMAYCGAPSWFITFSPADIKHPVCLYFADTKEKFQPEFQRTADERFRLIASNPVAGARFFDFTVKLFIKHVLGVGSTHSGLWGETKAYYGTVEQQGRLTLHLHLLLWIKNSQSPQAIRDRIMSGDSEFQKQLTQYLENLHCGEFLQGTMETVRKIVKSDSELPGYQNPTETLPESPPPACSKAQCSLISCLNCQSLQAWWKKFQKIVDDLLLRSNVHICRPLSCMNNKHQVCKARFPRDIISESAFDSETGSFTMKHKEPQLNTFTYLLTYLLRCNSDVTSLLSGTAIKAVISYVTDYITKSPLKTHAIFDTVRSVFDKKSELLNGSSSQKEKARKILTHTVNALTAKMELGGPMCCAYLLGNGDHYTSHKFKTFFWRPFVTEAMKPWKVEESTNSMSTSDCDEKLILAKSRGQFIGLSIVSDYIYRPKIFENVSLYDWVRLSRKKRISASKTKNLKAELSTVTDNIPEIDNESLSDFIIEDSEDELNLLNNNEGDEANDFHFQDSEEAIFANESNTDSESDEMDIIADVMDTYANVQNGKRKRETGLDDTDIIDKLFLIDHPQWETHEVTMAKEQYALVPNFVGGNLPRKDQGNREFYCATMLSLFKPWRSGYDLRSDDISWDEAFLAYTFNQREKELITFFNLKYECNDARDDFSAQRKLKKGDNDMFADLDNVNMDNDVSDNLQSESFPPLPNNEDVKLGKDTLRRIAQMADIETVMINNGWLDENSKTEDIITTITPIKVSVVNNIKKWKDALNTAKKLILSMKDKAITEDTMSTSGTQFSHASKQSSDEIVKIVDQTYINHKFKAKDQKVQDILENVINQYSLNEEQKRAFRIVANHAAQPCEETLKMYLGGMGGTGKSQVIKALISYFDQRNESHRFIILAPTGSAAALVSGSTYHSALGIRDFGNSNITHLAQIKTRLKGVEYIFIDEVSMLSCRDMYTICEKLSLVMNECRTPFGGMNMIFAGDFAQLPPAGRSPSLYSNSVGTQLHSGMTYSNQQATIGKALWHQVTTVVILRQNMRQNVQSPEDTKFRTALENMRYKACTPDDIAFLRTRIAGRAPGKPKLNKKEFKYVSVITHLNVHRDKINELGSHRFAAETGQKLHHFYSIDKKATQKYVNTNKSSPKRKKRVVDINTLNDRFSSVQQDILWKLPHNSTDHHAGKLSLCLGMPVLIKYNVATECCVTNGAEAIVVGWNASDISDGKQVLDTLFVQLINPPKNIQIDGLPLNVVPIPRQTKTVTCLYPDDDKIEVSREQVPVLPNFAMTDYSSQGRTRLYNVVDLHNCVNHQSYYTCLSRGSTAEGTIIVQGFDAAKITGHASGHLRQEYRTLEILDEITKLRYEDQLPMRIKGKASFQEHRRNDLVREYQLWKGINYVPDSIHPAIKWTSKSPFGLLPKVKLAKWEILSDNKKKKLTHQSPQSTKYPCKKQKFSHESNSAKLPLFTIKRKADQSENEICKKIKLCESNDNQYKIHSSDIKNQKCSQDTGNLQQSFDNNKNKNNKISSILNNAAENDVIQCNQGPLGFKWDSNNYSCAYDALFTILQHIWNDLPTNLKNDMSSTNSIMLNLTHAFTKIQDHIKSPEEARDEVRSLIHDKNPDMFPWGQHGTNIIELSKCVLTNDNSIAHKIYHCTMCMNTHTEMIFSLLYEFEQIYYLEQNDLENLCNDLHNHHFSMNECETCHQNLMVEMKYVRSPLILAFDIFSSSSNIKISHEIIIRTVSGSAECLALTGIIYFGGFHFTARIIDRNKNVWYHNGMTTMNKCKAEGHLNNMSSAELKDAYGRKANIVIYQRYI